MKSFWYALLAIILFSSCNPGIKRQNPEDYIANNAQPFYKAIINFGII